MPRFERDGGQTIAEAGGKSDAVRAAAGLRQKFTDNAPANPRLLGRVREVHDIGPLPHPAAKTPAKKLGEVSSPSTIRMLTLAGSARRSYTPVGASRRVRVPEHDLVEIDRLGLRTPVTINAEARLCVDEGCAVAAGTIVAIGHRSLVGAAERAVEPHPAAAVMGGIEAHLHRGPALPRQVAPADLRARDHRRWGARCARGHLREKTHALAQRPRLDLEKGAGIAGLPVLEGILLDLVDDGAAELASHDRNVVRPVAGDLKGEAVPYAFTEFHELACAGRAIGSHLDLRPLAGYDAARLGLYRRRARALAVADVIPSLQHRLVRAGEPVALLHRDAADRLSDAVLDDADAQRLQLAVELTGDPPLSQQLRRSGRIVREELGED